MNRRIQLCFPISLLVLSILACSQLLPAPPRLLPSGRIVYQSDQNGNYELYLRSIRTGSCRQLTNNSANDQAPTYIRIANQIGFVSDLEDGNNIYVMDTFGISVTRVTSESYYFIVEPDWSADGKSIVVSMTEDCPAKNKNCAMDIYTLDANGTNLTNLTHTPAFEWAPAWSPDGSKIAFASDRDGDNEIYVMNKDGTDVKQLTDNHGYEGRPHWSPDGTKIAFETDRDGEDWDIYTMNADGTDPQPVTKNSTHDLWPSWSPDGEWLVYVSTSDGDYEIFIIDIHGQNQHRVTNNEYDDRNPVWLP